MAEGTASSRGEITSHMFKQQKPGLRLELRGKGGVGDVVGAVMGAAMWSWESRLSQEMESSWRDWSRGVACYQLRLEGCPLAVAFRLQRRQIWKQENSEETVYLLNQK